MKKVHVAVIDDGIERDFFPNIYKEISYQKVIKRNYISHATFCAAIIEKHVKKPVNITSITVLDQNGCGKISDLLNALEWCYKNGVNVINLSLGSTKLSDGLLLRRIINALNQQGIILVCASDNIGKVTYPACFSNTIGVKSMCNSNLLDGQWNYLDYYNDGIEIGAFSDHELFLNSQRVKCKPDSNSFAAPLITANVINMYQHSHTINFYKEKLYLMSQKKNIDIYNRYIKLDWLQKAVLLFVGKDNFSLSTEQIFEGDLKIVKVTDLHLAIGNLNNINANSTVILYCEKLIDVCLWRQITKLAYEKKMEIIYLDKTNYKLNNYLQNSSKYWFPLTDKEVLCACAEYSTITEIKCPRICMACNDILFLMQITGLLKNEFFEAEYEMLLATNNPLLTIIDAFFIGSDIFNTDLFSKYCNVLGEKIEHDVFLIALDANMQIDNCDLFILISMTDNKIECQMVSELEKKEFIVFNTFDLISHQIYQEIIKFLS